MTVCTVPAAPALAEILDGHARLSGAGLHAAAAWLEIPISHPHVTLDAWCLVPDHLHGVLWIEDPRGAPIDDVVRRFKEQAARRIRAVEAPSELPLWRPDHHVQPLRSYREVTAARAWVEASPQRWEARQPAIPLRGEPPVLPPNR